MASINKLFPFPYQSKDSSINDYSKLNTQFLHMGPQELSGDIVHGICIAHVKTPLTQEDNFFLYHVSPISGEAETKVKNYLQQRNLSHSQQKVINRILVGFFWPLHKQGITNRSGNNLVSQFWGNKEIQAPRLLITGDPGSGKSYVIETIQHLASLMSLGHVATCSYNGIAAVNIDGNTICTLFKINDRSTSGKHWQLDEDSILKLKQKLFADSLCTVIVDEVSTIDTRIVALLNYRLQQLMGNYDAPFGGIPILFFGDMNQLGPVQKTFIPKDMLTWALRNVQTSRNMQTKCGAAWDSPAKIPISSKKTNIAVKCSTAIFKKNLRARFAKETSASKFDKKDKLLQTGSNLTLWLTLGVHFLLTWKDFT